MLPPLRTLPPEAHAILAAIRASRAPVISSSGRLDGDGLGSELGLLYLCDALGVKARVVNDGAVPRSLRFLPGLDRALAFPTGLDTPADLLVTVDTGARDLLGGVGQRIPASVPVANIDHHLGSTRFGKWNWVDHDASATGELVYELVRLADVPVSAAMATNIYTAIMTDTGGFAFSNTSARTHAVTAHLLAAGAEPSEVSRHVNRSRRLAELRLNARVIDGLRFLHDGRCAVARCTLAMLRETGADLTETSDLVQIPKSVDGVEVAVLLKETPDGTIKVSLRSEGGVDVNRVAGTFGGGGHFRASGCTIRASMDVAEARLLEALAPHLARAADPAPRINAV